MEDPGEIGVHGHPVLPPAVSKVKDHANVTAWLMDSYGTAQCVEAHLGRQLIALETAQAPRTTGDSGVHTERVADNVAVVEARLAVEAAVTILETPATFVRDLQLKQWAVLPLHVETNANGLNGVLQERAVFLVTMVFKPQVFNNTLVLVGQVVVSCV